MSAEAAIQGLPPDYVSKSSSARTVRRVDWGIGPATGTQGDAGGKKDSPDRGVRGPGRGSQVADTGAGLVSRRELRTFRAHHGWRFGALSTPAFSFRGTTPNSVGLARLQRVGETDRGNGTSTADAFRLLFAHTAHGSELAIAWEEQLRVHGGVPTSTVRLPMRIMDVWRW